MAFNSEQNLYYFSHIHFQNKKHLEEQSERKRPKIALRESDTKSFQQRFNYHMNEINEKERIEKAREIRRKKLLKQGQEMPAEEEEEEEKVAEESEVEWEKMSGRAVFHKFD